MQGILYKYLPVSVSLVITYFLLFFTAIEDDLVVDLEVLLPVQIGRVKGEAGVETEGIVAVIEDQELRKGSVDQGHVKGGGKCLLYLLMY